MTIRHRRLSRTAIWGAYVLLTGLLALVPRIGERVIGEANCRDCEPARYAGVAPTVGTYSIGFDTGVSTTVRNNVISGSKSYWEDAYFGQQASVSISGTEASYQSANIKVQVDPNFPTGDIAKAHINGDGTGTIDLNPTFANSSNADFWKWVGSHEIGHLLGFRDSNDAPTGGCLGQTMMYAGIPTTVSGFPTSAICSDRASVFDQQQPGGYEVCAFGCPAGYTTTCQGDQQPDPNACNCCVNYSPIIIDLEGDGVRLSGLEDGVWFDINGLTPPLRVGWPVSPDDVWLALDRNQNTRIDNGGELFGNTTKLTSGDYAPNGYIALREFDTNADGWIDASDRMYEQLLVWSDGNRNGFSEPNEILLLRQAGVLRIGLDYHESRRRDRWGNLFRFRAEVLMDVGRRHSFDIYPIAAHSSELARIAPK